MSLTDNVNALAVAVATEINNLKTGDVPDPVLVTDIRGRNAEKRGVAVPFDTSYVETQTLARDTTGSILLQRGTTNVHPNPTFSGAVVGVIGSGGVWPTGMVITTSASSTLIFEILSVNTSNLRIKITRAANATGISNFGFRSSATPGVVVPDATRGGYTSSVTVGIVSATANVKQVKLAQSVYNPPSTTLVAEPSVIITRAEGTKRASVWGAVTSGQGILMALTVELTGSTTDAIECVLDISQPQIEDSASITDTTFFTTGTRAAGVGVVRLPPGTYSSLLIGPGGGLWADHSVTTFSGWTLPIPSVAVAVSNIYVFNGPLSITQKNKVVEAVAPVEFAQIIKPGTALMISGQPYQTMLPATPYGGTYAKNRQGLYRFEVGPGERSVEDIAAGRTNGRAEVFRIDRTGYTRAVPFDTDVWSSYSMLIEDEPLERAFHILGQWHGTDDASDAAMSPLLHLNLTPTGEMQIVTRSYPNATTASASDGSTTIPYREQNYPKGIWVNWVFKVRFAKTGNGFVQAWRNGVEVLNQTMPIGSNDTVGPYWQFGAYVAPSDTNRFAVQYANVEAGTTSLAARVSDPLPIV